MRVSEYRGYEIYSDRGNHIGEVEDVALDTEEGTVFALAIEKKGENWKSIPYKRVTAVGDIIIVRTGRKEKNIEIKTDEEKKGI